MAILDGQANLVGESDIIVGSSLRMLSGASFLGDSSLASNSAVRLYGNSNLPGTSALAGNAAVVVGMPTLLHANSNRSVPTGSVILEQLDFFLGDGKTRAQGITPSDLKVKLQVGRLDTGWPLVSGVGIPDSRIASGKVYFEEFEAGYYCVRFYPTQVGLWRLILSWATGDQSVSQLYDVTAKSSTPGVLGLRATFLR